MVDESAGKDMPVHGTAALLLKRLDDVADLVDQGRFWDASEALRGSRWRDGIDVTGVPEAPLKRSQQWVNAAHDTLHCPPIDVHVLRHILLEARRALAS